MISKLKPIGEKKATAPCVRIEKAENGFVIEMDTKNGPYVSHEPLIATDMAGLVAILKKAYSDQTATSDFEIEDLDDEEEEDESDDEEGEDDEDEEDEEE
jgi:hypothetical protein